MFELGVCFLLKTVFKVDGEQDLMQISVLPSFYKGSPKPIIHKRFVEPELRGLTEEPFFRS